MAVYRTQKTRPILKVVNDLMEIGGEVVIINPEKTALPDLCKLALAEMVTGDRHEIVKQGK